LRRVYRFKEIAAAISCSSALDLSSLVGNEPPHRAVFHAQRSASPRRDFVACFLVGSSG